MLNVWKMIMARKCPENIKNVYKMSGKRPENVQFYNELSKFRTITYSGQNERPESTTFWNIFRT